MFALTQTQRERLNEEKDEFTLLSKCLSEKEEHENLQSSAAMRCSASDCGNVIRGCYWKRQTAEWDAQNTPVRWHDPQYFCNDRCLYEFYYHDRDLDDVDKPVEAQ